METGFRTLLKKKKHIYIFKRKLIKQGVYRTELHHGVHGDRNGDGTFPH